MAALPSDLDLMVDDLHRLVLLESKSGALVELTACAEALRTIGTRILGAEPLWIDSRDGPILQWRLGSAPYEIGLIGHYDTVQPIGSGATMPFTDDGTVIKGAGTFDMKAGIVTMFYGAADAFSASSGGLRGLLIHCCPDEETGSHSSRPYLQKAVEDGLKLALIYEGAGPQGAIYGSRKSCLWMEVTFKGRDAHASRAGEGSNALDALADFVVAARALADEAAGTTVVVTTAHAGTATNTAPGTATLTVDCRTITQAEQDRVLVGLQVLPDTIEGVTRTHEVQLLFPPMEPRSGGEAARYIQQVARDAGMPVPEITRGFGISDGSHLAGFGVAVVDGLGPLGGEDHSPHEWIDRASMLSRRALTAAAITGFASSVFG
jgi:glutamate carboxypeptidase